MKKPAVGGYVELHAHSAYSFLDGVSQPHELAARAAELGYNAFALTDHDGVYGAMEFAHAAKPLGVKPITGAELSLDDGTHLTLLAESRRGYINLCNLLTLAHANTRGSPQAREQAAAAVQLAGRGRAGSAREQTPPLLPLAEVERHAEGLICLSGCAARGAVAGRIEQGRAGEAEAIARRLLRAFGGDNFRIELQRPFARHDRARNRALAELAQRLHVAVVATGNVHAHSLQRAPLQDVFVALRCRGTLDETEALRRGNRKHVLAEPARMAERFAEFPEAVHETGELAARIEFDLTRDLGYGYPGSEDENADRNLAELCHAQVLDRYSDDAVGLTGSPRQRQATRQEATRRLEEELRIIGKLGLSGFFLLHHELLVMAREIAVEVRGASAARALLPPGRGRGSSVSSLVCYLTGLSHVDPLTARLSIGRFLNDELNALPDIDLDFPRDIRHVLIPRVHNRFGNDRAALVAAFACYRTRGSVRDLGKALGLPSGELERVVRSSGPGDTIQERVGRALAEGPHGSQVAESPRWQALLRLLPEIHKLPRHVSQHSGGMVISTSPLIDLCPVQPAAMAGRQIVQWDKDSCADAGFLKIDLLGLGMLSAVERCVDLIAGARGEQIDLSRISLNDAKVYKQIQAGETTGVFQIESRAQMQMLVRSRPESLEDLMVQVAIVRPGPILGGAVHPYLARRKLLRADPDYRPPYEHPLLEPILEDTLGAIIFQDQVIEVAVTLAGFSPSEAEGLRRAMSRKRSEEAMRFYRERFVEGAIKNGVDQPTAERVFEQIVGFSGFGFPKAHAAAFGLLAYQTSWLRCYYGPEFVCSLLNEQPMGFYPPDALAHEAQRRAITVLPAEINASIAECSVEPPPTPTEQPAAATTTTPPSEPAAATPTTPSPEPAIRIGLGYVKGVDSDEIAALVGEREANGNYHSVADLASRSGASAHTLELLAWAGACDQLCGGSRREALWLLGASAPAAVVGGAGAGDHERPVGRARPAGVQLSLPIEPSAAPVLRQLDPWDDLLADYSATGMRLGPHPLALLRESLGSKVVLSSNLKDVPDRTNIEVAGLVVARQRPATARGVVFVLLEDEYGTINLILPPPVYEHFRVTVRSEPLLLARGRIENRSGATNVLVANLRGIERPDTDLDTKIHDLSRRAPDYEQVIALANAHEVADAADIQERRVGSASMRSVAPVGINFGRRGR